MRCRGHVHHRLLRVGGRGAGPPGPVGGAGDVRRGAAGPAGNQPGRRQVDREAPAPAAGRVGHLHAGLCHWDVHAP